MSGYEDFNHMNPKMQWLLCPVCQNKTRIQLRRIPFSNTFHCTAQNANKKRNTCETFKINSNKRVRR